MAEINGLAGKLSLGYYQVAELGSWMLTPEGNGQFTGYATISKVIDAFYLEHSDPSSFTIDFVFGKRGLGGPCASASLDLEAKRIGFRFTDERRTS